MQNKIQKPCRWCGEEDPKHFPFQCFDSPKRKKWQLKKTPLKLSGKVAKAMKSTREYWFSQNPPDKNGFYHCYLNISKNCTGRLMPYETFLDHVKPRSSHPELRYDQSNLMPCCFWCNGLKGSRSLEEALKLKDR